PEATEHGTIQDPRKATFSFVDEDHTLANAARFTLNQDSIYLNGFSGDPAREVLKDGCQYLMLMCQHVRINF
ncbi:uncharacterized protein LOC110608795, partial [Manihot esculenta]|uniref:uncharacterized protein LOC110608795 n=1 Tax=Manihot esculenta TaxID=3983 RepID=UPI000B5D9278